MIQFGFPPDEGVGDGGSQTIATAVKARWSLAHTGEAWSFEDEDEQGVRGG